MFYCVVISRRVSSHHLPSAMAKINVKFLIHKEQKRVVFAEAGSDFVDLLFSFLTLPLGRIVRLLSKRSDFGSLDSFYESVEQLDAKYLQTEACKDMLLNPRSVAAELCENLKIKGIHDPKSRSFYTCSLENCLIQPIWYYTYTSKGVCCRCGKLMGRGRYWIRNTPDVEGGVFVIGTRDFIITDDLQVMPLSFGKGLSLIQQLQIKDSSVIEEKVMHFGTEEALNLLRRSLVSKNVLTEIYFPDSCVQANRDLFLPTKDEFVVDQEKKFNLELILNKNNNNVLYADVGDDFVNQLVSFLTFPLGSVLKFLSGNRSSLGNGIQNLYSSAEGMNLDLFKSEICKNMLLTPTLPTFYNINNQIFELEEIASRKGSTSNSCAKCYEDNGNKHCTSAPCIHGISKSEYIEQNPKVLNVGSNNDGAFVVSSRRFMVSDNLHISPLSVISAMGNEKNLPISDLVKREVSVDKTEIIFLMSTMLISKRVLTDIFSPKSKPLKRSY